MRKKIIQKNILHKSKTCLINNVTHTIPWQHQLLRSKMPWSITECHTSLKNLYESRLLHIVCFNNVTAASSGTKYSGEVTTSDPVVTLLSICSLGYSCHTWLNLNLILWMGSTWHGQKGWFSFYFVLCPLAVPKLKPTCSQVSDPWLLTCAVAGIYQSIFCWTIWIWPRITTTHSVL